MAIILQNKKTFTEGVNLQTLKKQTLEKNLYFRKISRKKVRN